MYKRNIKINGYRQTPTDRKTDYVFERYKTYDHKSCSYFTEGPLLIMSKYIFHTSLEYLKIKSTNSFLTTRN